MDETITLNWLRDMWKPVVPRSGTLRLADNVVRLPRAALEPVMQTAPFDWSESLFGDGNVVNAETVFTSNTRGLKNFIWFLKYERESGYNVANSDIVRGETLLRIATKRDEARKWKEPKWGTGPAMIALDDMSAITISGGPLPDTIWMDEATTIDPSVWSSGAADYQTGRNDLTSYIPSITITGIRDIPEGDGPHAA